MSQRSVKNVSSTGSSQQPAATTSNIPPSTPQAGDDIIVRLCIAIVSSQGSNSQPNMRLLTPADERISIPLRDVRTFAEIRRCLRLLLRATMAHHGFLSTDMSHNAVILPASRHPQRNGLLGITDDENVWQAYVNMVASMYHAPCNQPETCQSCREPAIVVACFPEDVWNQQPGNSITMRDNYSQEHGITLRRISTIEEQRYIRLVNRLVTARSGSSATGQNANSANVQSSQVQTALTRTNVTDPTKGPKGRTLLGSDNKSGQKPRDYSKGTLYPANAEKGTKAEGDTCLTCIRYNRKCKGTTMKFVESSRKGRKAQYKCDQCRNPQRRCLWRTSMNKVTTYEQAFDADGGTALDKNTVQGRKERVEKRAAAITKREDSDEDGEDDGDEEAQGDDED